MTKIQSSSPQLQNHQAQQPWEAEGPAHVRQLRRAITAHRDDRPVDTEVAPMLADLLARLDAFIEPQQVSTLAGPKPPNLNQPPTAAESMQAMGQASAKLKQLSHNQDGAELSPQQRQRVDQMTAAVDRHLAMKREVVLKVGQQQR